MKKYFPLAGGILDIVAGSLVITVCAWFFFSILLPHFIMENLSSNPPSIFVFWPVYMGVAAIIGGFFACFKRHWRIAVLGSTFAVFGLLGIPALILILFSEKEFKGSKGTTLSDHSS